MPSASARRVWAALTTVLDVKVLDYPTHAASLPVAVIPNCAATRHIHFTLDGSGPAVLEPPNLDLWPKVPGPPTPARGACPSMA
jgi:fumarate hydratase class I